MRVGPYSPRPSSSFSPPPTLPTPSPPLRLSLQTSSSAAGTSGITHTHTHLVVVQHNDPAAKGQQRGRHRLHQASGPRVVTEVNDTALVRHRSSRLAVDAFVCSVLPGLQTQRV